MGTMENSSATIAPVVLRNLIISILIHADKFLINLAQRYKIIQTFRYLFFSYFFFSIRFLPSFFADFVPSIKSSPPPDDYTLKPPRIDNFVPAYGGGGDSGIARALSQLLSIVNDIPVSSRKYEVVRSLAETLIDENQREGNHALHEVNRSVLSSAFARTLGQLEAAVAERGEEEGEGTGDGAGEGRLRRVMKAVRSVRDFARRVRGGGGEMRGRGMISAEKLAAELLWLAQKLAACGCGEEAVWRWAAASNLGWLALSADPRLQCSLVKVAAFLFIEAKEMGADESEEGKMEQCLPTKLKMLQTWLPLLCRGSNGTDAPVLSMSERGELEKVLEESIEELEVEEEQEQVLSLWLHHFTHSPSSDWPNLHACYTRWCSASRKQFLLLE
ncbi:uncharacterized protein G2W53_042836 [Senna tora]|uniref:Uncharacterized protein n=1 Tax=Senna tora TaxID=362788 RepID=A0A834SFZ0_9FABA|nr:uncharacterized protein G2W53_042836 [Senna tora]